MTEERLQIHARIAKLLSNADFSSIGTIRIPDTQETRNILQRSGIDFTPIRNERLEIRKEKLPIPSVFKNEEAFLSSHLNNKFLRANEILIVHYQDTFLSWINGNTFLKAKPAKDNFFIDNAKAYLRFLDFLEKIYKKTEESSREFYFVDYLNLKNRRLVLISLAEPFHIVLTFPDRLPHLDPDKNFSKGVAEFIKFFNQDPQHPRFLKTALIKIASRYPEKDRFIEVFKNLNEIVSEARINFEIYINNLSIDKLRQDYDRFKQQYFDNVSTLISKVIYQLIGLPVIAGTSLYTAISSSDKPAISRLIIALTIVVILSLLVFLYFNWKDASFLWKDFSQKFDKLKSNVFFQRYPEQLESFREIKKHLHSKIIAIYVVSVFYFIGLLFLLETILIRLW